MDVCMHVHTIIIIDPSLLNKSNFYTPQSSSSQPNNLNNNPPLLTSVRQLQSYISILMLIEIIDAFIRPETPPIAFCRWTRRSTTKYTAWWVIGWGWHYTQPIVNRTFLPPLPRHYLKKRKKCQFFHPAGKYLQNEMLWKKKVTWGREHTHTTRKTIRIRLDEWMWHGFCLSDQ